MKVAIIGAGFSGLTAAYHLGRKGHRVFIFEKEMESGGLAGSLTDEKWEWPLEKYYHHFFSSDKEVLKLAKELNIKSKFFFKVPKSSVFIDGNIYRFDNPRSILSFPKLNFTDKVRIGAISFFLKINPFWKPLEKITAEKFIQISMGKNPFNIIWKPLLESKFGKDYQKIPASWFWTRIKKRSFSLGYFEGGYSTLVDSLQKAIIKNNGKIFLGKNVDSIKKIGEKFEIRINGKTYSELFDKIIATVSPATLLKIFLGFTLEEKEKINKLASLGSLCLILELEKSFLDDGTYWLSVNDINFPFVAVVEHTNFIDKKYYNNSHVLYICGYYPEKHEFFKFNKGELIKKFIPYLKKINKNFDDKEIEKSWLFKDSYAQPIVDTNYSNNLPQIKTSIGGFFWASLHHVYPYDRGVNYAIKLGRKIADEIIKK